MTEPRLRIFAVEDHAMTARALKAFLQGAGYVVQLANDMASALTMAKGFTFDVLVCDLNLPDGTGWELLERLRRKGPVRAIAFSAFSEAAHLTRSEEAGFLEHFVKGSPPEKLIAAIQRVAKAVPPPALSVRRSAKA